MAVNTRRMCLLGMCLLLLFVPLSLSYETSYWQTYVKNSYDIDKHGQNEKVCLPTRTNTRETMGTKVTTNSSTTCYAKYIVPRQLTKDGWKADFGKTTKVLALAITSGRSALMSSLIKDIVVFVSKYSLQPNLNFDEMASRGGVEECTRYNGIGFKVRETMVFKCQKPVEGRYFYIWGLRRRLMNSYIDVVKIEIAIEAITRSGFPRYVPTKHKEYVISFVLSAQWDVYDQGCWMITTDQLCTFENLVILLSTSVKGVTVLKIDVATFDISGNGHFHGDKKATIADGAFIVSIKMKGNRIRIMKGDGDGLLGDEAIQSIEMLYTDQKGTSLHLKSTVRVTKTEVIERSIKDFTIKPTLRVWLQPTFENTGWIMVNMTKRFFIVAVGITSGDNEQVTQDLKGLEIATSNFIPVEVPNERSKLLYDLCGDVSDRISIPRNSEKLIKCMPEPSLGSYVLVYNKNKPLRISAIKKIVVFVKVDVVRRVDLVVPKYPRVPDQPPYTTLHITNFFVTTSEDIFMGFWVIDMFQYRTVHGVVVKAGAGSLKVKSFGIYVQDAFIEDHYEECASMMTSKFQPGTHKYMECYPSSKTGRHVVISTLDGPIPANTFESVELWFYVDAKLYAWKQFEVPRNRNPPIYMATSPGFADWFILHKTNKYQQNPAGWWVLDLKSQVTVYDIFVKLTSRSTLLEKWIDLYAGLMNKVPTEDIAVCSFRSNYPLTPNKDKAYNFVCANHHFKYRYVVIRSAYECLVFNLDTVSRVDVVYKDQSAYKKVEVDTVSFKSFVPKATLAWNVGSVLQQVVGTQHWIIIDLLKKVNVAQIIFTVDSGKKEVDARFLEIYVANSKNVNDRDRRTCFFHHSIPLSESDEFYENNPYRFRCHARDILFSHVFLSTPQYYFFRVYVILKDGGKYYKAVVNDSKLKDSSTGHGKIL